RRAAETLRDIDEEQYARGRERSAHPCSLVCSAALPERIFLNEFHQRFIIPASAAKPTTISFHSLASSPVLAAMAVAPPATSVAKPYSATLSPARKSAYALPRESENPGKSWSDFVTTEPTRAGSVTRSTLM